MARLNVDINSKSNLLLSISKYCDEFASLITFIDVADSLFRYVISIVRTVLFHVTFVATSRFVIGCPSKLTENW